MDEATKYRQTGRSVQYRRGIVFTLVEKELIVATIERKPELFSENEKKFVELTYGINGERMCSSREIANKMLIPRDKVNDIYKAICQKARTDSLNSFHEKPRKIFVESLGLSTRATNVLRRNKVFDVADLAKTTISDLQRMRGIGVITVAEIKGVAKELGIILQE